MDTYSTVVKFFQDGGVFMYPIALVLAAGLAVAIERFVYLSRARTRNRKLWDELLPLLKSGKYQQVMGIAANSDTAIGKMLHYGINRVKVAHRREDIEAAMEEGLMEVIPRLERRTHYLATLANVVTLMGLLGTIIGLIKAFTAVANVDPATKAELLSASISIAMNATAFGLIVAIPFLLIYAFLQARTTEIVASLEVAAVKFLNLVDRPKSDAA